MPGKLTIRVLVIDDDRDDCRLIRDLLEDSNTRAEFIVDEAHTAQEGFCQLQQTHYRYDVVLLDYKLPDSDGLTFLQNLNELHFRVPIIIVTSHGDRNLQAHAIEIGAVEYLEKGTFGGALLERTCLYAIGVEEKRRQNGGGAPGVGLLIEQLVGLTRESVKAQTMATQEIRELRQDFAKGLKRHSEEDIAQHDKILSEIRSNWTVRGLLDWAVLHPLAALVIFVCLVLVAVLFVLLLDALDVGKLQVLKNLKTTMLTTTAGAGWIT